jgi:phage terminase small subunit
MTPDVYAANTSRLTDRQERFVREFLIDGNAGRAAIRAGYSRNSAYQIGHQNLRKLQIRKRIEALQSIRNQAAQVSAAKVLEELCYIAFSDIREVRFTADGHLDSRNAHETARAIAQLEIDRTETKDGPRIKSKVRLYDKRQALVSLMEHFGLLRPKLPPIEVLLHRLPPAVASKLREIMSSPPPAPDTPIPMPLPIDCGELPTV